MKATVITVGLCSNCIFTRLQFFRSRLTNTTWVAKCCSISSQYCSRCCSSSELACGQKRPPFIHFIHYPSAASTILSSGVAEIDQWPHFSRCNAILHERCHMLPAGLSDIDEWFWSAVPLQSWVDEVSEHILHQIILGYLAPLLGRTIISLFSHLCIRTHVNFWQKYKYLGGKRESFHLCCTCALIPACSSSSCSALSVKRNHPHVD